MDQSRGFQGDGRPQNTCRTHQQSTQTGNDAICRPEIGSPLPTTIQNQDLVSHQDGFGNHRTEPAWSTKSDNDDDRMQKKSENVAHAEDGIRLRKLKNSGRLRNSPPTRWTVLRLPHYGGLRRAHRTNHLTLPHSRETRRRRNGRGVQGPGQAT